MLSCPVVSCRLCLPDGSARRRLVGDPVDGASSGRLGAGDIAPPRGCNKRECGDGFGQIPVAFSFLFSFSGEHSPERGTAVAFYTVALNFF